MKKILLSLSLLLAILHSVNAQQIQVLDTPPDWAFMMSNLNTSQITSGILYNKTAMFCNLYDYNRGKYNLSHADHFKQAINELHYASEQTRFISAQQLKTNTANTPASTISIGIINTTLHQLNFNEKTPAESGLTFVNGKFVAIVGQPSFVSRKIIIASPLQEMATGTTVNYQFANNLIYTNATTAINNLTVYFNDAVPVSIISNGVLILTTKTINYSTSGNKVLKFVATFTDNSSITTVGYHYFAYQPQPIDARLAASIACDGPIVERGMYKSTEGFQGYDETTEYLGKFDYTVFYHTKNPDGTPNTSQRKLIKPILIIDGFDPGDTRRTTDCDCEQDTSDNGCFSKNSVDGVFNSLTYESIFDLMQYQENGKDINLVDKLKGEGYDVIILNIPKYKTSAVGSAVENKEIDGGGDYMERNGRTLASYIQYVNGKLIENASTERLVIIGPSMGGLISRYALAYMEKKQAAAIVQADKDKWNHNTRIWVSFDAPHLGANIPMGAQANIWFFGNKLRNNAAKDKFDNQLNSVAGKQLLISQFSNTLATLTNGTGNSNNSPYFVQFQNNLNGNGVVGSGGFPVSTSSFRKIAIVNGSLSGAKSGVESAEFLNIRGYKDPTITEGLISGAVVGSVVPFVGTFVGAVFGSLLGASKANVTFLRCRDKFYPTTGVTDDIFNGDGQNFSLGLSQWYINHKWYNLRAINNDLRGSLDVVPAGTFTTGKILRDEIVKGLTDAGLSNEIRSTPLDTHSFIPAFSALAHLQPNQNWSNPLNTNLTCPTNKLTPFDSYFGANSNTAHISLTKDMVDWLMKELGDSTHPPVPQAPSFPIQANLLTGPDILCDVPNTNYSISDMCKVPSPVIYTQNGATVNGWSVSSNLQIISSTGNSINVTGLQSGSGTITATFQNGESISKTITIYHVPSLPIPSGSFGVDFVDCYNDGALPIDFFPAVPFGGIITYTPNILAHPLQSQTKNITVKYTNPCTGAYTTKTIVFYYQAPACSSAKMATDTSLYLIYPNPSSDIVNIDLIDPENQPIKGTTISGELFDIMGQSKSKVEINENKATFSVKGLIKGIYVLKIYINDKVESHQIAVE